MTESQRSESPLWDEIKGFALPVLMIGVGLLGLGYLLWRSIPLPKGGLK